LNLPKFHEAYRPPISVLIEMLLVAWTGRRDFFLGSVYTAERTQKDIFAMLTVAGTEMVKSGTV
jgi:hypothetical protein